MNWGSGGPQALLQKSMQVHAEKGFVSCTTLKAMCNQICVRHIKFFLFL